MDALSRRARQPVFGTGTSVACWDLMKRAGASFPEAHVDADKMTALALAGHTVLGLDVVMPLFSVCHEAAAMGCQVNWGRLDMMPEARGPIFHSSADIRIPPDLLKHPACAVALQAIGNLRKQLGDAAAVCGKVFGPWTQSYHYFGIEKFLIGTLDDPDETRRILDKLVPVTLAFAEAQLQAGADCLLLADHATRDLCSPRAYERFVMPLHQRLAREIRAPVILHICGNTIDRIAMIAQTGLRGFHWDTKSGSPRDVREQAGNDLVLMGGVSNQMLLKGRPEQISTAAAAAVDAGIDIVGPECAIPLATPLENLLAITQSRR